MQITVIEKSLISDLKSIWSQLKSGEALNNKIVSNLLSIELYKADDILYYCYYKGLLNRCVLHKKPYNNKFSKIYIKK